MSLAGDLKRSIKAARKRLWKGNVKLDPAYAPMDLLALREPVGGWWGEKTVSAGWGVPLRKLYLQVHPAFPRARRAA